MCGIAVAEALPASRTLEVGYLEVPYSAAGGRSEAGEGESSVPTACKEELRTALRSVQEGEGCFAFPASCSSGDSRACEAYGGG